MIKKPVSVNFKVFCMDVMGKIQVVQVIVPFDN